MRTTAAGTSPASVEPPPGGLDAHDGYQLIPATPTLDRGPFRFTITGPSGEPVTRYEKTHDRELHLIVASHDLKTYAHLHPQRDASGAWSADVVELPPGPYRVFADFQPEGASHQTLGVDAAVTGEAAAPTLLRSVTDTTVDGFHVELRSDVGSELRIVVRRNGETVVTEPYLGAAGHLVALRAGDLAYLHVHPLDDEPRGPVRFAVDVPSAGVYALFFDFQVDGLVRTAHFVLDTDNPPQT